MPYLISLFRFPLLISSSILIPLIPFILISPPHLPAFLSWRIYTSHLPSFLSLSLYYSPFLSHHLSLLIPIIIFPHSLYSCPLNIFPSLINEMCSVSTPFTTSPGPAIGASRSLSLTSRSSLGIGIVGESYTADSSVLCKGCYIIC